MSIFKQTSGHGDHHDDCHDEESALMVASSTISSYSNVTNGEGALDTFESLGDPDHDGIREKQNQFVEQTEDSSNPVSSMQENIQDKIEEFREEFKHVVVGSSRGPKRDLSYDQSNHVVVLLRMYGSIWPKVLPYCIANVIWTFLIYYLSKNTALDLTLQSNAAHTFMSTLVSFLVVSRSNITYARFMESRQYMGDLCTACRDNISMACNLTMYDESDGAKQWRRDLAYNTIVMLRTVNAVINYQSTDESFDEGHEAVNTVVSTKKNSFKMTDWFESERTTVDENFRAPTILADKVRGSILKQRTKKYLKATLASGEELLLLGKVNDFLNAFQGIKKLMTTPFPFPLVQMTRWFLFAWIFTIPMTLTEAMHYISETMVVVFFITYGFLGIEYVSIEMDDPFGDDASDIDHSGLAEMVYEDIYLAIVKADGQGDALKLRRQIRQYAARGNALDAYRADISNPVFWEKEK
eukprot:CAMPEP_0119006202 /NCGR_PEP_ID=MMETSP1176-20130426/2162_1 /TAXON_ID=265551 /ORGANISM="Synedropsis recta cf, Strain CCMP1620" /LENGTH=467 /DNA_ID=CAMNT_0006958091 /DNA_START=20 /DNA_END=1420 /DNA_ORIENTATION=+